jgi:hypothetical protein
LFESTALSCPIISEFGLLPTYVNFVFDISACISSRLDIVHIEDVDILIRYNIRISPVMDNVHIMVDKRCTDTGGGYQGYYYDTLMEVVQTWTEKDFPNE